MSNGDLLMQAKALADDAARRIDEYSGVVGSVQRVIVEHFGQNGLYAAYVVVAALILLVAAKLAKITFSTLKYVVVPSLALAFLGTFFVPYSFTSLLPVTVTCCSLVLLFKG
ncbi:MAG: hypothetical protein AB1483_00080 [Candidatus Zixiibacteriota bacterium]